MQQAPPYHISESARRFITKTLNEIEEQHNVRILYACESGSRAWGFSSVNSDYDVRFLYMHPRDWYLSVDVERRRDVIELPIKDELDINGWDVRKALWLLRKSNPTLMEWLRSPIVYHQQQEAVDKIRGLIALYYSKKTSFYHHLNMAQKNFRKHLQDEEVQLKQYFYVLRSILSLKWLENEEGPAPIKFGEMVEHFIPSGTLDQDIHKLLADKRKGKELETGPHIESIDEFLEEELNRLTDKRPAKEPKREMEPINTAFRSLLTINF